MSNTMLKKITSVISLSTGLLGVTTAHAAGFGLDDQAATYLGNAYAGTCSAVQDASTAYYNPAGLTFLKGKAGAVLGGTYVWQHLKLYNETALNNDGDVVTGNRPSKPEANLTIPYGHIGWRLNNIIAIGFSVVEPFGFYTEYGANAIPRFMASKNKLKTLDLSPSIALKVLPTLSVGIAVDFLRVNTQIASSVAWGLIGSEARGFVVNTGGVWTSGYHFGLLYKCNCTQIGLAYFSKFTADISATTSSAGTQDFFRSTAASYTIDLPEHLNLGFTQNYAKWSLMGEVQWTRWNRVDTIGIVYNTPATPGIKRFNFENTWRVSLGADYQLLRKLTLKGGLAYDQTPTRTNFRLAMAPDSTRYIIGLGARYAVTPMFAVVAGYAHTFYRNSFIYETANISALNSSQHVPNLAFLYAKVQNSSDKLSLEVVFDVFKTKKECRS